MSKVVQATPKIVPPRIDRQQLQKINQLNQGFSETVGNIDFSELIQSLVQQAIILLANQGELQQLPPVSSGGKTTYTIISQELPTGLRVTVDGIGKIECDYNADTEFQRQEATRLRTEFERAYVAKAYEAALAICGYDCRVRYGKEGDIIINAAKPTGESVPVVINKQGIVVVEYECFRDRACEKEDVALGHLLGRLGVQPEEVISQPKAATDDHVRNTPQHERQ